jgi:hypothetical protein
MIRFYVRGRIGRHVSWVLPVGDTRSFSRRARPPSRAVLIMELCVWAVIVVGGLWLFAVSS